MPNEKQQGVPPTEAWDNCQPGEIQGMVKSLKRSRRNRELVQVASVGATFVLLFAITLWSFPQPQGANGVQAGKFACVDVLERAEDYVAGHLDAAINGRIEEHLAHCPSCQTQIDNMRVQAESEIVLPPVLQNTGTGQISISSHQAPKKMLWTLAVASK